MEIKNNEPKEIGVYVRNEFWRMKRTTHEGWFWDMEREAANNFTINADFDIYMVAHPIDNFISVPYIYEKFEKMKYSLN